jgi:hypothetical protein
MKVWRNLNADESGWIYIRNYFLSNYGKGESLTLGPLFLMEEKEGGKNCCPLRYVVRIGRSGKKG